MDALLSTRRSWEFVPLVILFVSLAVIFAHRDHYSYGTTPLPVDEQQNVDHLLLDTFDEHYGVAAGLGSLSKFADARDDHNFTVITFANMEYLRRQFTQNLVCSWQRLALQNWIIVAVDEDAYREAASLYGERHVHYSGVFWRGVKSHALRGSTNTTDDYIAFIHRRTQFVLTLLHQQRDLHLIITDGDTAWLRHPLQQLPDVTRSRCHLFAVDNADGGGDKTEHMYEAAGGFLVLLNREPVRLLYRHWLRIEHATGFKEQSTLRAALSLLNAHLRPMSLPTSNNNNDGDEPSKKASKKKKAKASDKAQVPAIEEATPRIDEQHLTLCFLPRTDFPTYRYLFLNPARYIEQEFTSVVARSEMLRKLTAGASALSPFVRVSVAHPNVGDKDTKVSLLREFGFWFLADDTDNGTCDGRAASPGAPLRPPTALLERLRAAAQQTPNEDGKA